MKKSVLRSRLKSHSNLNKVLIENPKLLNEIVELFMGEVKQELREERNLQLVAKKNSPKKVSTKKTDLRNILN